MSTSIVFRRSSTALAALAVFQLAGCGGGGSAEPPPPQIGAAADVFELRPGTSAALLANDSLGGQLATAGSAGNVSFAVEGETPAGISAVDGSVTVAADAAPGVYSLAYRLCQAGTASNCASTTASITVLRVLSGQIVTPDGLEQASAATLASALASRRPKPLAAGDACPNVPAGYSPVAGAVLTPLDAAGTVLGSTITTDACGAFEAAVSPAVEVLAVPAEADTQARDFVVASFTDPTSAGSLLPTGATPEISAMFQLAGNEIGLSVIDSSTKKAILGLQPDAVAATVSGAAVPVASLSTGQAAAPASTALVMDASGSMSSPVYTDSASGIAYDRYSLASIAAGSFIDGKNASEETAMVIFDSTSNVVNDAFLATQRFSLAADGSTASFTVSPDGFTVDPGALRTIANFYNPGSAIYQGCYLAGSVIPSCYDYLPSSDTSLRVDSRYVWGGGTALWDGAQRALEVLASRSNLRKFVVAMTDGQDNSSSTTRDALIAQAKLAGVPVWMVGFGSESDVNEADMKLVAEQTGGSYFRKEDRNIVGLFQGIETSIRFQYTATLGGAPLASGQVVKLTIGSASREITIR